MVSPDSMIIRGHEVLAPVFNHVLLKRFACKLKAEFAANVGAVLKAVCRMTSGKTGCRFDAMCHRSAAIVCDALPGAAASRPEFRSSRSRQISRKARITRARHGFAPSKAFRIQGCLSAVIRALHDALGRTPCINRANSLAIASSILPRLGGSDCDRQFTF